MPWLIGPFSTVQYSVVNFMTDGYSLRTSRATLLYVSLLPQAASSRSFFTAGGRRIQFHPACSGASSDVEANYVVEEKVTRECISNPINYIRGHEYHPKNSASNNSCIPLYLHMQVLESNAGMRFSWIFIQRPLKNLPILMWICPSASLTSPPHLQVPTVHLHARSQI